MAAVLDKSTPKARTIVKSTATTAVNRNRVLTPNRGRLANRLIAW
jgi:hypothetical protein